MNDVHKKSEIISKKIESILFFLGDFVKLKDLSLILEIEESEVLEALKVLENKLEDRGLTLLSFDSLLQTTES